jgi:hypothetical protein
MIGYICGQISPKESAADLRLMNKFTPLRSDLQFGSFVDSEDNKQWVGLAIDVATINSTRGSDNESLFSAKDFMGLSNRTG